MKDSGIRKRTKGDLAHAVAKGVLGAVPVAGGAASEFFHYLVSPPLEKRRVEWMEGVSERLRGLEEKGISLEDLQKNEQFISTLMQATQAAMRTHQKEKLEALKNLVLNSAKPQPPSESLQQMFVNFIDSMTEWHLRLLKLMHAPPPVPGLGGGGLSTILEHNYPELRGKREFYDQIWRDLYLRGLVKPENLNRTITGSALTQQQTTVMGAEFLAFIEE